MLLGHLTSALVQVVHAAGVDEAVAIYRNHVCLAQGHGGRRNTIEARHCCRLVVPVDRMSSVHEALPVLRRVDKCTARRGDTHALASMRWELGCSCTCPFVYLFGILIFRACFAEGLDPLDPIKFPSTQRWPEPERNTTLLVVTSRTMLTIGSVSDSSIQILLVS